MCPYIHESIYGIQMLADLLKETGVNGYTFPSQFWEEELHVPASVSDGTDRYIRIQKL